MYAVGLGVLKDHRRAHMWWNISALNGIKSAAENKMRIERMMSSDQVDKAKQMARECVLKKKLTGC
jgi:TPR repeat protein